MENRHGYPSFETGLKKTAQKTASAQVIAMRGQQK